jgi:hypothetical protein
MSAAQLMLMGAPLVATNVVVSAPATDARGIATLFQSQFKSPTGPQVYSFVSKGAGGEFGSLETEDLVTWQAGDAVESMKQLAQQGVHNSAATSIAFFEGTGPDKAALSAYLGEGSVVLRVNDEYEASYTLTKTAGQSATAELGSRLRYVVRLDSRGQGITYDLSTVSEDVPADAGVAHMRGTYRMLLEYYDARGAVADSKGPAARGGFVGSTACSACHTDAYEIWEESLHFKGMEALADDLRDGAAATSDPDCIQCHSVGFGFESGYGSKELPEDSRWGLEKGLAGIGCESCHGPGAQHSRTTKVEDIDLSGQHTCLRCHDSENDPDFNFERKWPYIEHNDI